MQKVNINLKLVLLVHHNEKFLLQRLQFIATPSDAIKWWELGYDVLNDFACSLMVLRKSS